MESGIGDTAKGSLPAPRCRLHLTQPEPRGWEKEARTTQTLPVETSPTGRNSKAKKRRSFLTPVSCYKGRKANSVQRQLAGKRASPGGGLPPGLRHLLGPFSLQPSRVTLMQESPRVGEKQRLGEG